MLDFQASYPKVTRFVNSPSCQFCLLSINRTPIQCVPCCRTQVQQLQRAGLRLPGLRQLQLLGPGAWALQLCPQAQLFQGKWSLPRRTELVTLALADGFLSTVTPEKSKKFFNFQRKKTLQSYSYISAPYPSSPLPTDKCYPQVRSIFNFVSI